MIKAKDPASQGQILFISSGFSALYGDCIAVDKMLITLFFDLPILFYCIYFGGGRKGLCLFF